MGYRVAKQVLKDGSITFKILFEWFDAEGRHNKGVPKEHWPPLGLHPRMTLEQAKARVQQLNAQDRLKRTERKRVAVITRIEEERQVQAGYLPEGDVTEFERTKLFGRHANNAKDKTASYWNAARRLLCELRIDPEDWADRKESFYDYFSRHQYSPAYVQKLIPILNRWGNFVSRKYKKPFEPLEYPRGIERERIADAYHDKGRAQGNKTSLPLTPEALDSAQSNLKPEHFNWLLLSVYFGLRPSEVDALKDERNWRIEDQGKVRVLFVYQSKLRAISRDKRWKPIPCILREQRDALKVIESGEFKRPLPKTVSNHFGEGVTLYGGRKGFTDLMLSKGQKLEDISTWMGHTSIERTWKSYKNRQSVSFTPIK